MSPRPASLPMYDADRSAVQSWWHAIARELRGRGVEKVPAELAWPVDLPSHWSDANLLLSQMCGYPLVTAFKNKVQVVGALRYTAPGCSGISYRSDLVARADDGMSIEDFRGRIAVANSFDSHSGFNALRGLVAPLANGGAFFGSWRLSGSHRESMARVRSGEADIAAIDCVSLAGFQRQDAHALAGLRILGSTAAAPGLPLVCGAETSPTELRTLQDALRACCEDPDLAPLRETLFIGGFEPLPAAAWQTIDELRISSSVALVNERNS